MPKITQSIKENITITQYAQRIGLHPIPRGVSQVSYKLQEHDSCVINYDANGQQRFFWNSQERYGSVIDFCMAIKGCDKDEAIKELREMLGGHSIAQWDATRQNENHDNPIRAAPVEYKSPEMSKDGQRRIFAYLLKTRKLSNKIVTNLVKDKQIYQDVKGNVVFIGRDYDGQDKYAFYRSTLSDVVFRGETPGGNKLVNFSVGLVDNKPKRLFVCESSIDALSVASMLEHYNVLSEKDAFLSLGGTHTGSLEYHVNHNSQLQRIYLCQDNDTAGDKSRAKSRELLEKTGFKGKIIDKPPVNKDFNQDLIALRENNEVKFEREKTIEPTLQNTISN